MVSMAEERLHKVLAHAGVASRRASEDLIRAGRVAVNDVVVTEMGVRVDPETDRVTVDGKALPRRTTHVYLALNKPRGYVTTVGDDPYGRPTVLELVRRPERVYPVGRLDFDTEGLLILTNDGELAHRMMHPRYHVQKEYLAKVRGVPDPTALRRLRQGVPTRFQPEPSPPHKVELLRVLEGEEAALVKVVISEGAKHQVRDMLEAVGYPVLSLRRTRVGPVLLGELRRGLLRELTAQEVAELRRMVRLPFDEQALPATPSRPHPRHADESPRPRWADAKPARPRPPRVGNQMPGRSRRTDERPAARPPRPAGEQTAPPRRHRADERSGPPPRSVPAQRPAGPRRPWWADERDEHPPQVRTWHAQDARPAPPRPAPIERSTGPRRPWSERAERSAPDRPPQRTPGGPPRARWRDEEGPPTGRPPRRPAGPPRDRSGYPRAGQPEGRTRRPSSPGPRGPRPPAPSRPRRGRQA
jgi:pseudouridine synthase